jgi:hypothetical protein
MARLIRSYLSLIDEHDETPEKKEMLKRDFLSAVGAMIEVDVLSPNLIERLKARAAELRIGGQPEVAGSVEALIIAVEARLSRPTL